MPGLRSIWRRFPWFPLTIGISLAVGFIVPSIYELFQQPAARSRHYGMERAAIVVLVITVIACALLACLRRNADDQPTVQAESPPRKFQFKLGQVFIGITLMAVTLALVRHLSGPLADGLVAAIAIAIFAWGFTYSSAVRYRLAALLAIIFLPFTWMIAYNVPFGHLSGLAINIPTGPGILLAALLHGLVGNNMNMDGAARAAIVVVIIELLIGARLAKRGGKLWVVYAFFVFMTTCWSSFIMHALIRA